MKLVSAFVGSEFTVLHAARDNSLCPCDSTNMLVDGKHAEANLKLMDGWCCNQEIRALTSAQEEDWTSEL